MASQFFGLNIGTSALYTYSAAVNTTLNNIANVQTEGYSRQTTTIESTAALRVNAKYGSVGTGVNATQIMRERDQYYDSRYWTNNSKVGDYEKRLYYLNQIQGILKDDSTLNGFTTIFNEMFNALELVKNNAADVNIRNQFINEAQKLCSYFNSLSSNLKEIQTDCNEEIKSEVSNINSLAEKIATLNREINVIEVRGGYANELRDQRDLLLDQLSAVVSVETTETEIPNTYGENLGGTNFRVIINGQLLVDGNDFRTLECVIDGYGSHQTDVDGLYSIVWTDTGMDFAAATESAGGSLKALFAIRDGNNDENLKGTVSTADNSSITLSNLSNTSVNALNLPSEGKITVGSKIYEYDGWEAQLDENGSMTSVKFQLKTEITDREADFLVGQYTQCGKSVDAMGVPYYQSQMNEFIRTFSEMFNNIEQDGEDLQGNQMGSFFVGYSKAGEEFDFNDWKWGTDGTYPGTISSESDSYYQMTAENFAVNKTSMKDPNYFSAAVSVKDGTDAYDLVEELMTLQSDVTMFRGDKASTFLETILSDIAVDTQKMETSYENYYNLAFTIDTMRTSISGVDEDEEGINLIKFQEAYNLACKVISVLNEMYDKLINETGV